LNQTFLSVLAWTLRPGLPEIFEFQIWELGWPNWWRRQAWIELSLSRPLKRHNNQTSPEKTFIFNKESLKKHSLANINFVNHILSFDMQRKQFMHFEILLSPFTFFNRETFLSFFVNSNCTSSRFVKHLRRKCPYFRLRKRWNIIYTFAVPTQQHIVAFI
jgi:hypothetical protein